MTALHWFLLGGMVALTPGFMWLAVLLWNAEDHR